MKAIVWRCGGTSRSLWRKMPQVLARADGNKEGRIEGGGSGYGGRARLALRFSLTPNLISSHFHLRTARPAYHNSNGRCLKPRTLAKKAKARGQTSNPRAGPASKHPSFCQAKYRTHASRVRKVKFVALFFYLHRPPRSRSP